MSDRLSRLERKAEKVGVYAEHTNAELLLLKADLWDFVFAANRLYTAQTFYVASLLSFSSCVVGSFIALGFSAGFAVSLSFVGLIMLAVTCLTRRWVTLEEKKMADLGAKMRILTAPKDEG